MSNGIPKNAPIVYVSFSAEVNPQTTEALIGVMSNCATAQVQQVHLLLSTPDGSVMHGMNIYSVIKGMPFELITHNVANVDSIGNVLFLAGTKRYATTNSTFMFHGVGFNAPQNQRFEEKDVRERLRRILSDQNRIGDIIAGHSNLNTKHIRHLFREASTKDANWALDKGIIHEIRDVNIPKGCPIVSLVFQRQGV